MVPWQCTQEGLPSVEGPAMASTISEWHLRHAAWAIRRLRGVICMGSGNQPVVKAKECQKPFDAFVTYLPTMLCGVWQSLQVATARWLEASQLE